MLTIQLLNHAELKLDGDLADIRTISDHFSYEDPAVAMKKAKNRRLRQWNGVKRIIDMRSKKVGAGLLKDIIEACSLYGIQWQFIDLPNASDDYLTSDQIFSVLMEKVPKVQLKRLRDYQLKGAVIAVHERRAVLLSPTASGKTLMMYVITQITPGPKLVIVPTIGLITQFIKDIAEYSEQTEEQVRNWVLPVYGEEKVESDILLNAPEIIVGTWQSLIKYPPEFFLQFQTVMGDEAHGADAASVSTILLQCINAEYRIGTSGTLKDTKVHEWKLQALFGPIHQLEKTHNLIDRGMLTPVEIRCIILKHHPDDIEAFRAAHPKADYNAEREWLINNPNRNKAIAVILDSLPGNTLTLFANRAHGSFLKDEALQLSKEVYYVDGTVDAEYREDARLAAKTSNTINYVCSYKTFSTGISINNLNNLVMASGIKAIVTLLQSIGRLLRLHPGKECAYLVDIVDDMTSPRFPDDNYRLKHFKRRLEIYGDEQFSYVIKTINLPKLQLGLFT